MCVWVYAEQQKRRDAFEFKQPKGWQLLMGFPNADLLKSNLRAHFLILVRPQWDQVSAEVFDLLLPFLHSFKFIQDGLPESKVAASNNM